MSIRSLIARAATLGLSRPKRSLTTTTTTTVPSFSTSASSRSLMDFFEAPANLEKSEIKHGRPWKVDELRIKNNKDLHKLWYVLLKEVNMLMTMEEEYRRVNRNYPNPERLDKCEESMENILQVVRERDEQLNVLETGLKGEPRREWRYDELGRPFVYEYKEHLVPEHLNEDHRPNPFGYPSDNEQFHWLLRERDLEEKFYWDNHKLKHQRRLKDAFPENEELTKVPDPQPWKEDCT